MSSADLRAAVRRRARAVRDALVAFVKQRPELAAAVIFGLALLLIASVAMTAEPAAPAPLRVDVAVDPAGLEIAEDCGSGLVVIPGPVPKCLLLVGHDGSRIRVEKFDPPQPTVGGASSRVRAIYARTEAGKRGVKLGEVTVGTVAKPIGITCDLDDAFMHGEIVYARVTDPRAPADGYAAGCKP